MRTRFETSCTFCEIDPAVNIVLYENDHWRIWENPFMQGRGTQLALLIASKMHWRRLTDITRYGWTDMGDMMHWISATYPYDLAGGMLFMRFGDMRLNAGTVPHLHWNLWVPNQEKEVRVPIFKKAEDTAGNIERAAEFASRYEAGEVPE